MNTCDHKFVDSTHCLKCGWAPHLVPRIRDAQAESRSPDGDGPVGAVTVESLQPEAGSEPADSLTCTWTEDEDAVWTTQCGQAFVFTNDEGPRGNRLKFCGYCGKPVTEARCDGAENLLFVCSSCWTGANLGTGWMQRALKAEAALVATPAASGSRLRASLCINCAYRFIGHECRYYYGANEVGPLCQPCDALILLDLITLMPDSQVDEILAYVATLRDARRL